MEKKEDSNFYADPPYLGEPEYNRHSSNVKRPTRRDVMHITRSRCVRRKRKRSVKETSARGENWRCNSYDLRERAKTIIVFLPLIRIARLGSRPWRPCSTDRLY